MRKYKHKGQAYYHKVNDIEASGIIDTRQPLGKFIHIYPSGLTAAIDNEDGNAWTEDFTTRARAVTWLFQE